MFLLSNCGYESPDEDGLFALPCELITESSLNVTGIIAL